MAEDLKPGMDAESVSPRVDVEPTEPSSVEPATNSLAPGPGQESADALVIYPRERYVAAARGLTPREDFARDLVAHVRGQIRRPAAPPAPGDEPGANAA